MSALQAIPTSHGIEILNSELKNTVTKYQLVGALTHNAAAETLYTFHTATIETSYYDENGVLTFILNLPIETHFDEYLHRIDVLDSQNQAVIECPTPKIALAKGIGGMVTLKAAIKGQAGDVVFKHGEYVTGTELNELYLPPIVKSIEEHKGAENPHSQYVRFSDLVGEWKYTLFEGEEAGWLDLKGGICNRVTDAMLWTWAQAKNIVVSQSLKDTEPKKYAGFFGDGDNSRTFTLPNLHLGHFVRGARSMSSHGAVDSSAIQNITARLGSAGDDFSYLHAYLGTTEDKLNDIATGAFKATHAGNQDVDAGNNYGYGASINLDFDASRVVPTADENRPDTLNLNR